MCIRDSSYGVRITCDPIKRELTLHERSLDMLRANEVFAGQHFTRSDDRHDYGEPRYITAGWLDSRPVSYTHLDVYKRQDLVVRLIALRGRHFSSVRLLPSRLCAITLLQAVWIGGTGLFLTAPEAHLVH